MKITSLLKILGSWKNWAGLVTIIVLSGVFTLGNGRNTHAAAAQQESPPTPPTESASSPTIQQFSAGGYVLGFQSDGFLMAAMDHMLKTTFVDAKAVQPLADGSQSLTDGKQKTPPLGKVSYPDLWQGVSMTVESDPQGSIKIGYQVAAGGSVDKVRLRFNRTPEITADGVLLFRFEKNELRLNAPQAWQEVNGNRQPLVAAYRLDKNGEVTLALGEHDPAAAMAVEGSLLWNTFLDRAYSYIEYGMTLVNNGSLFVTGKSTSTWGEPRRDFSGDYDIFVAKLDSSGNLLWNTFLVGDMYHREQSIVVDGSGNLLVTGTSNTTWGNPVRSFSGRSDGFAAKLNANGDLLWNTFLGGDIIDTGYGITLDSSGNALVTGTSETTWGNPIRPFEHNPSNTFVAKLNSTGTLVWNTFLGGMNFGSYPNGLNHHTAIDGSGNLLVMGESNNTWGNPIRSYSSTRDVFVAKLASDGSLLWNTFLGGEGLDLGYDIGMDGSGNLFIAGISSANWGNPLQPFSDDPNLSVAKLNSSGNLQWNTFLDIKMNYYYYFNKIAVDGSGNLFITGYSNATWGNPLRTFTGNTPNFFVAKMSGAGSLLWNTFLLDASGDSDYNYNQNSKITVDDSGNLFVTGLSQYNWGTPVRAYAGRGDAFVAKLAANGSLLWNTFLGSSTYDSGVTVDIGDNGSLFVTGVSDATWGDPVRPNPNHGWDIFVAKLGSGGEQQTISGKVTNKNDGTGLAGVTITPSTGTAVTTGIDGTYTLTGITSSVEITPSLASCPFVAWTFEPAKRSAVAPGASGQDFVADCKITNIISGKVTNKSDGSGLTGVTISASGTGIPVTTTTTVSDGTYSLAGINAPATLTPSKLYCTFEPAQRSAVAPGASGQDFVATCGSPKEADLLWNTFLEEGFSNGTIALDGSGNAYVSGYSTATWGTPRRPFSGSSYNPFVAKLSANGDLLWNTFLGEGASYSGIALDGSGNVYVSGTSFATWGTPRRPFSGSSGNPFVAKLNANGELLWNTFLGESYSYGGFVLDGSGDAYVSGYSRATWGTPLRPFSGSFDNPFVAKLSANGDLLWNTFLGEGYSNSAIALDSSGNAYMSGYSRATWGTPLRPFTDADVFVAKLSANGDLLWNTFLGEAYGFDNAISLDGSGNALITGSSRATWGTPRRPFSDSSANPFVAKLSANGDLLWNTFLGEGYYGAITLNGSGNAYVSGFSQATWGTPLRPFSGSSENQFVAKLSSNGDLLWNTFLGGTYYFGYLFTIALDGNENAYVSGTSRTTWGKPLRPFSGSSNNFVAKLSANGDLFWNTFLGEGYFGGIALDGSGNTYVSGRSSATWGTPLRPFSGSSSNPFVAKLSGGGIPPVNPITSKVTNKNDGTGLAGVTNTSSSGIAVTSAADGNYTLTGISSPVAITPSKPY